jgi:hypothetical protein
MGFIIGYSLFKGLFQLVGGMIVLIFQLLGFLLVACRDLLWAIHDSRKSAGKRS